MNRRTTMVMVVSVVAAMIVAYGAVTGLAAVGVPNPTGTNAIVAQPALFAATAGATGAGPVAVDDSYSIVDGLPLTIAAPGVLANDSNAVRVVPVTGPAQGSLTLAPTGAFTYDPMGTTGTVTFTYQASDGAVLSSVAVVTITVSTQSSNGTVATNPTGPDGAALYTSSCAVCHGADGNTIASVQLGPTSLTNAQLVAALSTGKMSAYAASMSTAEIQAVADYVGTLGVAPPATTPTTTTTPPPPTTTPTTTAPATTPTGPDGAALYASAGCAACHGAGGFTPSIGNAAVVAKLSPGGSMNKYAGSLSAADIQAVADFLAPPATGGGGSTPPATGGGGSPPPPPAAPTTGSGAYASYCAACHGADGTGTAMGPDIIGESSSEIYKVVRKGDGTMPAFSASMLSDQTLTAIADYMATFGPGTDDDHDDDDGDDGHGTSAPSSSDGASVYTSFCAACHGADGTGTAMGPDIIGESSSEIYEVVRKGDGTMPAFSYQVLSDTDLTALADYIASWGGGDGDHSSDGDDRHDKDDD